MNLDYYGEQVRIDVWEWIALVLARIIATAYRFPPFMGWPVRLPSEVITLTGTYYAPSVVVVSKGLTGLLGLVLVGSEPITHSQHMIPGGPVRGLL